MAGPCSPRPSPTSCSTGPVPPARLRPIDRSYGCSWLIDLARLRGAQCAARLIPRLRERGDVRPLFIRRRHPNAGLATRLRDGALLAQRLQKDAVPWRRDALLDRSQPRRRGGRAIVAGIGSLIQIRYVAVMHGVAMRGA